MHWTRANWQASVRERARASAVLPTPGIVLDEDVALGEERHDDVAQHVVAHLHGAADVLLDRTREGDRGLDLLGGDGIGQGLGRLHEAFQRVSVGDERRLKTASRTAAATACLPARGTCRSPVRGDDGDLVLGGVEADARRADVVDDDRVELLALQLGATVLERAVARLGGEADEQLAGTAARGETGEHVLGTFQAQREFPAGLGLLDLVRAPLGRPVVGDGGRHQQDVAAVELGGAGRAQLGGALHVDVAHARAARQRDVGGHDA